MGFVESLWEAQRLLIVPDTVLRTEPTRRFEKGVLRAPQELGDQG